MHPADESLARREATHSLAIACDGMKRYRSPCISTISLLESPKFFVRNHYPRQIRDRLVHQCVTISRNRGICLKRRSPLHLEVFRLYHRPVELRSLRAISIWHAHQLAESGLKMPQKASRVRSRFDHRGALSPCSSKLNWTRPRWEQSTIAPTFSDTRGLDTLLRSRPNCAPTLSPEAYCVCRMMRITRARVSHLDLQLLRSTLRPS
jgi:hypothetical protein